MTYDCQSSDTSGAYLMSDAIRTQPDRAATGVAGLDYILGGGFPRNRVYLIEGDPGSGKTTLGLQFLLEGVKQGDPVLYVTLSETKNELEGVAASHGWDLAGVYIHELAGPEPTDFDPDD